MKALDPYDKKAATLEEVARFARDRYFEVKKQGSTFWSDEYSLLGQKAAYAAVFMFITGEHPDSGEKEPVKPPEGQGVLAL